MRAVVLSFALLLVVSAVHAKTWPVDGIVMAVDPLARTMLVSHRPIAHGGENYMGAMAMPFRVESASDLSGLYPGVRIEFELVVLKDRSYARGIHKSGGPDAPIPAPKEQLRPGDAVPDFQLTDQQGQTVSLASLRGKVLAVNFIYTRCPLPDVCPRLSAGFALLQKRLQTRWGADLALLSITVDPDYDTPPVLSDYAKRWGAVAPGWRFLTGNVAGIAGLLGEVYWTDEGSIGHNSTTSIIDRNGKLAARVDGSSWRADQLEKLIIYQLEKKP
jgi:protein SCO1/2